jgi:hypothetical protein
MKAHLACLQLQGVHPALQLLMSGNGYWVEKVCWEWAHAKVYVCQSPHRAMPRHYRSSRQITYRQPVGACVLNMRPLL